MNVFFRDFSMDIVKWRARIVMGDGNMACFAVEEAFQAHKLTANILAFHVEYVQKKDLEKKNDPLPTKEPTQLKWDSCGIWSIGSIAKIKVQGPARHCLAAAIWSQRDDNGGTSMGFVQRSYKRVRPSCGMLGKTDWPSLNEDIHATCMRWRETIAKTEALGTGDNKYRIAPDFLVREYIQYRKGFTSLDYEPRACESDGLDYDWPWITRSRELMCDPAKADPRANIWSKGGHWSPKVVINFHLRARDRGDKGIERMRIARIKKQRWLDTGVWPWYIPSDREAHHWSKLKVGLDIQGGECDGLVWRHARGDWLQYGGERAKEQLEEYERPWITANGQQAHDDALKNTEKAYQDSLERGETSQTLAEHHRLEGIRIEADKVTAEQESKPEGRSGEWHDSKRQRWRDTSWSSGGGRWHDRKRRR